MHTMNITPSSRNNRHLVLFNVAPYDFCAPAAEVESIIMLPPVSRLPMAPPSVIGLINHRGQVYRVISLRRKLGLETGPPRMEGQLILTSLPVGLTAFLVDEVVDVLPDNDLPRRPLSPRSTMDLFDAFILRDDQVLFHTTFAMIDQAQESAYPNPDLKTMAHITAATLVQTTAPDRSTTAMESTALDQGKTNGAVASEKRPGGDISRPVISTAKNHGTTPKTEAAQPRVVMTDTPATRENQRHTPPAPPRGKSAQWRKRASAAHARTRRYALALTGVLLLILIVTLSSGLLLKQHRTATQPHQDGAKVAPLPDLTLQKEGPEPSQTALPPQSLAKDSVGEPPPGKSAPDTPPKAPAPQMGNTQAPETDTKEEPAPPQTIAKEETSITPEETSGSSREILRMETETFTLMVERPSIDQPSPSNSLPNQVPPTSTEIVHRVVPGDTLWDIAERYLGDPFQYPALARLSQIRNPDLIYPGNVIRIIKKER